MIKRNLVFISLLHIVCFASFLLLIATANVRSLLVVKRAGPLHSIALPMDVADAMYCASQEQLGWAFCVQELPRTRHLIWDAFRRANASSNLTFQVDAIPFLEWFPGQKLIWAASSNHKRMEDSQYELLDLVDNVPANMSISITDYLERDEVASLTRFEAYDTLTNWTIEQVGPLRGRGDYEWLSAGWSDAGGFGKHLLEGPVYVVAFGFFPTAATGQVLGMPPVHIHHMHVSSSQSWGRHGTADYSRNTHYNGKGLFAIEFDMHGDRQCLQGLGGTECLMRAYPVGFGLHLVDPMETFFDLNDVRARDATTLVFTTTTVYRWTHIQTRQVVQAYCTISGSAEIRHHDDYYFWVDATSEYVIWSSAAWLRDQRIVHMYWHIHRRATKDVWMLSGEAADVGIATLFPEPDAVKKLSNTSSEEIMRHVLQSVTARQFTCLKEGCKQWPALQCTTKTDSWELLRDGTTQERFRAPHCNQGWITHADDHWTMIAYHAPFDVRSEDYMWFHVVLYIIAVQIHTSSDEFFSSLTPRAQPGLQPFRYTSTNFSFSA